MKKLSLAAICAVVLIFVVGLTASALAAPGIVVAPEQHDFGEVEIGSSGSTQIQISNAWSGNLRIESINLLQTGQDFSIIPPSPEGTVVPPGSSVLMGVDYSPTSSGLHTATLEIEWANGESGTSFVEMSGVGVVATGDPVTIEDVLAFFDASVEAGTLKGTGPGNSDEAHISVMRHVLRLVAKLISNDQADVACHHIRFAYYRSDGESPPPDFVEGDDVPEFNTMILELMINLDCQI